MFHRQLVFIHAVTRTLKDAQRIIAGRLNFIFIVPQLGGVAAHPATRSAIQASTTVLELPLDQ